VLYAHHVIVESEAARQSYIGHYKRFDKQLGWNGRFGKAEDKFVALGSPKYDRVINTKAGDCGLPDAWRRLIYRPDGTKKKVVLYNTHMFTWINSGGQYFKKLRSVFDTFRNRDDVVLWWRPHPNTELNFRTKRPQLLGEYRRAVAEYRRAGFGIYDDTADLHRAIACCDAYYGDSSSLVAMYAVTGKPVMIQKANIISGEEHAGALLFESCYDDGEYIWFATYWFNGLFKCSKETWVAEYLGSFPGERRDGVQLFSSVAECNGKLYFAPMSAVAIGVYDLTRDEFFDPIGLIKVDKKKHTGYSDKSKFIGSITYEDSVFLFPVNYPAVVKIDTCNEGIEYIDDWIRASHKKSNNDELRFCLGVTVAGKKIYAPLLCVDEILIIDCETSRNELIKLHTGDVGHSGICFDGNDFWLAPRCKNGVPAHLTKWNYECGVVAKLDLSDSGSVISDRNFINFYYKLFFRNGKVIALPQHLDRGAIINVETNHISAIDTFFSEYLIKEKFRSVYNTSACQWIFGDNVFVFGKPGSIVSSFEIESDDKDIKENKIVFDIETIRCEVIANKNACCEASMDCIYQETPLIAINNFLGMAAEDNQWCAKKNLEPINQEYLPGGVDSGERIYNYCKSSTLGQAWLSVVGNE
jgi:hypothetical protein